MRRLQAILLIALATAVAAVVFASTAAASAQMFNGHTSGVICGAGSNLTGGPFLTTGNMIAVSNAGGGYVLTCQFQYPAGSYPSSQITVTGFACFIWPDPGLVTFNSSFIATPGGRATMICRL